MFSDSYNKIKFYYEIINNIQTMISYNCSPNTSTIFVYLNTELNVEFNT